MTRTLLVAALIFAGWASASAEEPKTNVPPKPLLIISPEESRQMILDFLTKVPWKEIPADRIDRRADVEKGAVRTLLDGEIYVIGRWTIDRRDHRVCLMCEKSSPFLAINGEIVVENGKFKIVKASMLICIRPTR